MTSRFFRFLSKRGPKSSRAADHTAASSAGNSTHQADSSSASQDVHHVCGDMPNGTNKHVKLNGCEDLKESIEHYNQRCAAIKQLKEKEELERQRQQQQQQLQQKNKIPQALASQTNGGGGGGFLSFKSFNSKQKNKSVQQYQQQQPPQLSKDSIECAVIFLDDHQENFVLSKKALASKLYEQVFYHLDLIETDYFGLQFSDTHNVRHWLDPTKVIKKQCKIGPPYQFFFKVCQNLV